MSLNISDTLAGRIKQRKLPSVDAPVVQGNDELRRFAEGVKEHLRMYEGDSGAPKERFVTIEELERAGIVGTKVQGGFASITTVLGEQVPTVPQEDSSIIVSPPGGGVGANTLAGLFDTNVSSVSDGEFLQYQAGVWVPQEIVSDLDIPGATQYDMLYFDGTDWVHTDQELKWNPDLDFLELPVDHGVNWSDGSGGTVEFLIFDSGGGGGGETEVHHYSNEVLTPTTVADDMAFTVMHTTMEGATALLTVGDEYLFVMKAYYGCDSGASLDAPSDNVVRWRYGATTLGSAASTERGENNSNEGAPFSISRVVTITSQSDDLTVEGQTAASPNNDMATVYSSIYALNLTQLGAANWASETLVSGSIINNTEDLYFDAGTPLVVGDGVSDYIVFVTFTATMTDDAVGNVPDFRARLAVTGGPWTGDAELFIVGANGAHSDEDYAQTGIIMLQAPALDTSVQFRALWESPTSFDSDDGDVQIGVTAVVINVSAFVEHHMVMEEDVLDIGPSLITEILTDSFTSASTSGEWGFIGGISSLFLSSGFDAYSEMRIEINAGGDLDASGSWDRGVTDGPFSDRQLHAVVPYGTEHTINNADDVNVGLWIDPPGSISTDGLGTGGIVAFNYRVPPSNAFIVGDDAWPTHIDGTSITLDAPVTANETLNVIGAVDFDSTLNVDGIADFNTDVNINTGHLFLPADNDPVTPTITFGVGGDGFYSLGTGTLAAAVDGAASFIWTSNLFIANTTGGAGLLNDVASSTLPTVFPARNDTNTGLGWTSADRLAIVAGGVMIAEFFENATVPQLILPQVDDASAPTLAFGDGLSGFYQEDLNDVIAISIAGFEKFQWHGNTYAGSGASHGAMVAGNASATFPNYTPHKADTDTGIGWTGADRLSLVAGGVSIAEFQEDATTGDVMWVNTPLKQAEVSAANPDLAGFGQWWVRDDDPNVPMFTNDDGVDGQLARLEFDEIVSGEWTFNSGVLNVNDRMNFSGTLPEIYFEETDQAADETLWRVRASGSSWSVQARNDSDTDGTIPILFERTLEVVDVITLTSASVDIVGALTATSYGGIDEANLLDRTADETISGEYSFTNGTNVTGDAASINLTSGAPGLEYYETDQALNEKRWLVRATGGLFAFSAAEDTGAAGLANWLVVNRTGTTIDDITLAATTITINGALSALGNETNFGDKVNANGASPRYRWIESGVTADTGTWDIIAEAEEWRFRMLADDFTGATDVMRVERTAVNADLLTLIADDVVVAGALTADSYGGIDEENLLDKTATEEVSGAYTFSAEPRLNNTIFYDAKEVGGTVRQLLGIDGSDVVQLGNSNLPMTNRSADNTFTGNLTISNTQPKIYWEDTDAGVDEKLWRMIASGPFLFLQLRDDADTTSTNIAQFDRTGTTVDLINLLAPVDVDGALTATSFGGVASLDLLDKTAGETITANWVIDVETGGPHLWVKGGFVGGAIARFTRDVGADTFVEINGAGGEPQIIFDRDSGTNQWYMGLDTTDRFVIGDGAAVNSNDLFIITTAGDISATSFGGILEANLLSRIADESVSGSWDFTDLVEIIQSGGTANDYQHWRDSTDTEDLFLHYDGDSFQLRSEAAGTGDLYLEFTTGGEVGFGGDTARLFIPFVLSALTLSNQPNSEEFIDGATYNQHRIDITGYRQVRITAAITSASASVNDPRLYAQYHTSFSTTIADFSDIAASELSISLDTAGTIATSAWADIVSGAQGDIWLTVVQNGGDGVEDPAIAQLSVQFR